MARCHGVVTDWFRKCSELGPKSERAFFSAATRDLSFVRRAANLKILIIIVSQQQKPSIHVVALISGMGIQWLVSGQNLPAGFVSVVDMDPNGVQPRSQGFRIPSGRLQLLQFYLLNRDELLHLRFQGTQMELTLG